MYGIRSIIAMGMDSTRANMKKFFSRAELIHLARRSDYIGATITPPRAWARKSTPSNILSIKQLQDPLSPERLHAIAQLNLDESIPMLSPRESLMRSAAGNAYFNPSMSSNQPLYGGNQMYSRKEDSSFYDPRYQQTINSARSSSSGMNMGSFVD